MAEAQRLDSSYQRQSYNKSRGRKRMNQIKIGHGGTLDPMATGVLITGIGSGTKSLQNFLGCKKTYETTVLFGVATDTYDILGKVITRKDFERVTKDKVLAKLAELKGMKMQKPPIYSALRHEGKRFYEYAREGKELPIEIAERPVEITELELTAWMDGGEHDFAWPTEEFEAGVKPAATKVAEEDLVSTAAAEETTIPGSPPDLKRKRDSIDEIVTGEPPIKRQHDGDEPLMSGGLPDDSTQAPTVKDASASARPPACKIRMTVSSGFYVRSFCHDLGRQLGSAALMAELVRTRQQDFELGRNVFEYSELEKGEDVWAPQVEALIDEWNSKSSDARGPASPPRNESSASAATSRGHKPSRAERRRRNSSSESDG